MPDSYHLLFHHIMHIPYLTNIFVHVCAHVLCLQDAKKAAKGAAREVDRDISEKIALGQTVAPSRDSMFDARLFNQSEGWLGWGCDVMAWYVMLGHVMW